MIVIMVHLLDTLVQGLDFMVIILDLLRIGAGEGVIEMKVRQGIQLLCSVKYNIRCVAGV